MKGSITFRNVKTVWVVPSSSFWRRIMENMRIVQHSVRDLLTINTMTFDIPEVGIDYLVLWRSGWWKSTFLHTLHTLWLWLDKYTLPHRYPCRVTWTCEKEWIFKMDFNDENLNDWRDPNFLINQFSSYVGDRSWPTLGFRILHDQDPITFNYHVLKDSPVIFIHEWRVLYQWPISWLKASKDPRIAEYAKTKEGLT